MRRVKAGEWDGDRESRKGSMENTCGTKPSGVWEIIILSPMPLASSMRDSPKNPRIDSRSVYSLIESLCLRKHRIDSNDLTTFSPH